MGRMRGIGSVRVGRVDSWLLQLLLMLLLPIGRGVVMLVLHVVGMELLVLRLLVGSLLVLLVLLGMAIGRLKVVVVVKGRRR